MVNLKLGHLFSRASMILMKVHSNGAVCALISPSVGQQNNIIIDCFVCNRCAWCMQQACTQSPSSGDVGHYSLQVQVEAVFVVGNSLRVKPREWTAWL